VGRYVATILALLAVVIAGCGGEATDPGKPARSGTTLFLDGPAAGGTDRLVALDVRTGRSHTLPVGAGDEDAYSDSLVATGGKLVISSVGHTNAYDPNGPAGNRQEEIGGGWLIVPSATDGRVWLALRDHRNKSRAVWPDLKMREAREETVGGRLIQIARAPGIDWWPGGIGNFPEGAVKAGLVFATDEGLRIWSPKKQKVTARVRGRTPLLVDTHDNLVAWSPASGRKFPISNARTGKTTRVKPPAGSSFQAGYDGAFSPDGSLLALPVVPTQDLRPTGDPRDGARWSMALVNVESSTAVVIKGSTLDSDYHRMTWSPSGSQLVFSAGRGRIMAYRRGAPRARNVARVHGTIYAMAAL
jgi:hypothetical protein